MSALQDPPQEWYDKAAKTNVKDIVGDPFVKQTCKIIGVLPADLFPKPKGARRLKTITERSDAYHSLYGSMFDS